MWAGERDCRHRLERAIAAFRTARRTGVAPPALETAAARAIPARLTALAQTAPGDADADGPLWLAYQTVVREYLGPDRTPYLDGMRGFIASWPVGRALWIQLRPRPRAEASASPPRSSPTSVRPTTAR